MNREILEKLFSNILNTTEIQDIVVNYQEKNGIPLSLLGIDSLSMMQVALNIDEITNNSIDFSEFHLGEIETLQNIEKFLLERNYLK